MSRTIPLEPGDPVRVSDDKLGDLVLRVKHVDGNVVEVQMGGGATASFPRDQVHPVSNTEVRLETANHSARNVVRDVVGTAPVVIPDRLRCTVCGGRPIRNGAMSRRVVESVNPFANDPFRIRRGRPTNAVAEARARELHGVAT